MPWRHRGRGGTAPPLLTSALDGGQWPGSCPGSFTPGLNTRCLLDMSLGGPHSWSGCCGEEVNAPSIGKWNPAHSPVLYQILFNKSALPVLQCEIGNGSECGSLSEAEADHEVWCQTWSQMQAVSHVPGFQQLCSHKKHSSIAIPPKRWDNFILNIVHCLRHSCYTFFINLIHFSHQVQEKKGSYTIGFIRRHWFQSMDNNKSIKHGIYSVCQISLGDTNRTISKQSIYCGVWGDKVGTITESNAQMCKQWCHNHKTWTSDKCKHTPVMVRWVVLHIVPYIGKSLRLEYNQGSLQLECVIPTVKHWEGSVQQYRVTAFYCSHYYPLWPNYCKRVHGQVG
jgi:hypothetical protein